MPAWRLLPVALSFLLVAAHFLRAGNLPLVDVAAVTALSALVFRGGRVRRWFRLDVSGGAPGATGATACEAREEP